MATDIHLYVEIDSFPQGHPFSASDGVRPFSYGKMFIPRQYEVFEALAGGRSGIDRKFQAMVLPVYPPRGLPKCLSRAVFRRFFCLVREATKPGVAPRRRDLLIEPALDVSLEEAQEWVNSQKSFYAANEVIPAGFWPRWVSNPCWHTASWLYPDEFHASIDSAAISVENLSVELRLLLQIMTTLENHYGPRCVRLVFWFDN